MEEQRRKLNPITPEKGTNKRQTDVRPKHKRVQPFVASQTHTHDQTLFEVLFFGQPFYGNRIAIVEAERRDFYLLKAHVALNLNNSTKVGNEK